MNANLQPQTPAIKEWLTSAKRQLSDVGIPSPALDSELILAHALQQNRTYLQSHIDDNLDNKVVKTADNLLIKRLKRVPIAYIIGFKEFYGRKFTVTPNTLIPRPESEVIIEILTEILKNQNQKLKLIDVGTGSGCLGITAKLEFPNLDVTLLDISQPALEIARQNAMKLSAEVRFIQSDLLQNFDDTADIIIANLPYVNPGWETSPEIKHEPSSALFEGDNGMKLIKQLIVQTKNKLNNNGYLIIEADPTQHDELIDFANKNALKMIVRRDYIIAFSNYNN